VGSRKLSCTPHERRVDSPDRAVRNLAREEPAAIVSLLSTLLPGVVPRGAHITPAHVGDPNLEAFPFPLEVDFLGRLGEHRIIHCEFQSYRETDFLDRAFSYHLCSVQRYPGRVVDSICIWLIRPPAGQRCDLITVDNVTIAVHSIVLPEVAAELLLEDARTACFAIAAAPGAWTVEELCRRTVAKMRDGRASWHQWRVAGLVAMVQGRYKEFTQAMHEVKEDTTMVDDFMLACLDVGRREGLKLGRKQGVERGLKRGVEQGLKRGVEQGLKRGVEQGLKMARETLLVVLEARSLWPTAEERKKILTQPSLQRLHHWVQRAATVSTVAEALAD
jgi:hypothetical protein